MRVIAGSLKGRRLDSPDWSGIRPTSDKLRETLFNVLAARVSDARVLDAYAGTGAVGIEALSRGARHVTFVESDSRAARLVERNLRRCAITNRYAIIRARLAGAAGRFDPGVFDIVFLDPPYGRDHMLSALEAAAPLITPEGVLILEHARRDDAPARVPSLVKTRDILSGDSALTWYRRATPDEPAAGAI